jgi:predicted DNA binding CopG/RHH family protein
MSQDEVRVTIRVPRGLYEAVKAQAKADDVTMSHAIRWWLRAWVQGDLSPRPPRGEPEHRDT